MKKKLKFKIAITNIRRIIMSFLFVNLGIFFQSKVKGKIAVEDINEIHATCYADYTITVSYWDKLMQLCKENVFILLIPIAIIMLLIILLIKRIKAIRMEVKNDK